MQESHVLVSTRSNVILVDATDGAPQWQYGPINATSRCVVVKGDSAADSRVYVGDDSSSPEYDGPIPGGAIHELSFATGERLAKIEVGYPVRGSRTGAASST